MRRHARLQAEKARAPWLITLADLMTLLLAFFVTLVSLSVFDESASQRVAESVSSVFSISKGRFSPFSRAGAEQPFSLPIRNNDDSLEKIRALLDVSDARAVTLSRNNQVIVLSLNNALLFPAGQTALTPQGHEILERLARYLKQAAYPLGIASHGSPGPEDGLAAYSSLGGDLNFAWALSLERGLAVYENLIRLGVPPELLRLEAHGDSRPRLPNDGPENERRNRRIDFILDRRDDLFAAAPPLRSEEQDSFKGLFRDENYPHPEPPVARPNGPADSPTGGPAGEAI